MLYLKQKFSCNCFHINYIFYKHYFARKRKPYTLALIIELTFHSFSVRRGKAFFFIQTVLNHKNVENMDCAQLYIKEMHTSNTSRVLDKVRL